VLDFLRDTDPALLKRISRKLIYHLSWSGVEEAKEVLRRGGAIFPLERGLSADGNRPLPPDAPGSATDLTTEAFRIAEKHLRQTEILNCVTRWIKEDKAGFLVRAMENQDTSLGEIMECVERYRHIRPNTHRLSARHRRPSVPKAVRRTSAAIPHSPMTRRSAGSKPPPTTSLENCVSLRPGSAIRHLTPASRECAAGSSLIGLAAQASTWNARNFYSPGTLG
jgi:hypothetical protein